MRIALHDADQTQFPNLALMKLSAYHKGIGDSVEWFAPLWPADQIYSSKVFTFSSVAELPSTATMGGSGYDMSVSLPDNIEHIMPDYSLYNCDYSLGFLTRGCSRNCPWCIVPKKEGAIRANADIEEFLQHDEAVLLDNNILASDHGIEQIQKMAKLGIKVDFNQGLDARLIDSAMAELLSTLKWRSPVRLACDHSGQIPSIMKAVKWLRWHNVTPRRYFCYMLVKDIDDALERVMFLKGIDVDPFAQPYIDPDGTEPTWIQKDFARWVNHKAEFKSRTWEEYADTKKPNESQA